MDTYKITKEDIEEMARECHSYHLQADGSIDEFSLRGALEEAITTEVADWLDSLDLGDIMEELEQEDKDAKKNANDVEEARGGCY